MTSLRDSLVELARHCWRDRIWKKPPGQGPVHVKSPLTLGHLDGHLSGRAPAVGLAPIVPGTSTTRIAVLDLDSHKGEVPWGTMSEVALGLADTLRSRGYQPLLFRSSGGNGIHIQLYWKEPVEARDVRHMLFGLLAEHVFKPGTKGVAAREIEVFPKQDCVPADGAGSMFVLPFAGKSAQLTREGDLLVDMPREPFTIPHSPPPPPAPPPEEKMPTSSTPGVDLRELRRALDVLPVESYDYDQWRNIVFGIHHATEGSEEGLALADEWSARSSKHDPEFLANEVWPYVRSDRENAITARSIMAEAFKHGYVEDVSDDLDDLPPLEEGDTPPADPTKVKRFRIVSRHEFLTRPAPTWIVKRVLPRAQLGVIFGESGSGKSFLALDICGAIARGIDWRGNAVKRGRVVLVIAEGAAAYRRRIEAYEKHHGCELDVGIIPEAPNLLDMQDVKALEAVLLADAPDVIVIDTLAQTTPGADENSAKDMGKALTHCKRLHTSTGAMVILVHHAGKDVAKGQRGWSGLKAACDVELEVTRDGEERQVRVSKMKDGQDGLVFPFRLAVVPVGLDEDDELIESCVVEPCEAPAKRERNGERLGPNERIVMRVLHDLMGLGGDGVKVYDLIEASIEKLIPSVDTKGQDRRRGKVNAAIESLQAKGLIDQTAGIVIPIGR